MQQIYHANKISQSRLPARASYTLNTTEVLSFLNEGDILNVQVIDAKSSNILLALANGFTFNAQLTENTRLVKGSYLNLKVKNVSNRRIEMQIINNANNFQGSYPLIENTAYKKLENLKIMPDDKNLNIAVEFIKNRYDFNKKSLLMVSKYLNTFKELDIKTAVFMFLKNIEPIYIQIPLKINNYITEAEIYILKRKNKKKERNTQDITMLISIDTEKMGSIEILLNKHSNDIRLGIKPEKKEVLDFIKNNISFLYNNLVKKSYRVVDIKYSIKNVKSNILEDMLNNFIKSSNNTIDLRV
jgi:hypothetical protein